MSVAFRMQGRKRSEEHPLGLSRTTTDPAVLLRHFGQAGRNDGQRPGRGAAGARRRPRQVRSGKGNRELPSPQRAQDRFSPFAQWGGTVPFVEQQPATGLWWGWRALLF